MHGIFSSDAFRQAYLSALGAETSDMVFDDVIDDTLNALADHIEAHLDVEMIWSLAAEIECSQ